MASDPRSSKDKPTVRFFGGALRSRLTFQRDERLTDLDRRFNRSAAGPENKRGTKARALLVFAASILSAWPDTVFGGQYIWTSHGPDHPITALAASPVDPRTVYAATKDAGVYKTADGGETWARLAPEEESLANVTCLAAGSNVGTVFAGNAGGLFLRSLDGGSHWEARNADNRQAAGPVGALAVDQANGAIYLGTRIADRVVFAAGEPILTSPDAGDHWSRTGLATPHEVYALLADSLSGTLYAGTDFAYSGDYYLSEVGGAVASSAKGSTSWNVAATDETGKAVVALASVPGGGIVYAGDSSGFLYRSLDRGVRWESVAHISGAILALAVDPTAPNTLYTGGNGVLRSTDGGKTWNRFNFGLEYRTVTSLTIDATGTFLHAGTQFGVFDIEIGSGVAALECPDRLALLGSRFRADLVSVIPGSLQPFCARAAFLTDRFGYFSFPNLTGDPTLPEVFVKMVDATAIPGAGYWVFFSALTHLPYSLRVTDTETGVTRVYDGEAFAGGADTSGFPPHP